jgi:hypothetical protein
VCGVSKINDLCDDSPDGGSRGREYERERLRRPCIRLANLMLLMKLFLCGEHWCVRWTLTTEPEIHALSPETEDFKLNSCQFQIFLEINKLSAQRC